jgi:hypothetical protein
LFIESIQIGSPPLGKGRPGGIYGNAFSKNETDTERESQAMKTLKGVGKCLPSFP